MASAETDQNLQENNAGADDLLSGCDFLYTNGYCAIQNDLKELYSSLQDFVVKDEFKTHIQRDAFDMDNIEEKLEQLKVDVMRTECPIVIAGETSSGKSSIINLILGEKILPTGIGASTSRVCKVKHSDCYEVSTRDRRGEVLGKNMSFDNSEEMAKKLQELARTADEEISNVDIYMPVPSLQGNVMIVDTPGFGDQEQQVVAEKMMSYLPNALAFIFVINVSNAGGIQDDRIIPVLSKVNKLMAGMVSFSPKDVIFLLNKWDTISHEDEGQLETYFKETKEKLRKVWNDVDESRIFRISAKKVLKKKVKYTRTFDMFRTTLTEVITRNENKRVKVHLRYLNEFLEEFNRVLSTKLKCANENAEKIQKLFDDFSHDLEKLEKTRKEEISNIERNIDTFLYKASCQFHEYIHSPTFRKIILKDTNKATRISIGNVLDTCFENETKAWQEKHIEEIFQKEIMADLKEKFEKIHRTLHIIKDNLKGFKTPFNVDNKISRALALGVIPGGAGFVASVVLNRIATMPALTVTVATVGVLAGLVMASLKTLEVVDDFDTVCKNAFMARVAVFTVDEIKRNLRKAYFDRIKNLIETFFEGDLKREIERINDNISNMRDEKDLFKLEEETLSSLQSTVIQKIERLQQIERIDITTE